MKIGLITRHAEAASILRGAGVSVPTIPAGCNTISQHFLTAEGQPALVINQTGFAPTQADNEEECNGCMIAIALDADLTPEAAAAGLEQWFEDFLK
jgi:hypothetical protein